MMKLQGSLFRAAAFVGCCMYLAGCARQAPPAPPPPPEVSVAYPVERAVTDQAEFTGRTAAVDSVEVRARVSGYLDKVHFKEGTMVKKGDPLFEIDARTYQASLEQVKAKVALDEAQLKYSEAELRRMLTLRVAKSASQEEYDKALTARDVAAAAVATDRADLARRQLDLDFTKVTAPITGRTSKAYVTEGNLVQSGDQGGGTMLTSIVSLDPIYAYFDVDERTVLRVQQLIREGKAKSARETTIKVMLGLANEKGHPHEGTINFVDNQVNPKTGTQRVRGVFPNQKQILSPGLFVRVQVPIGDPHRAVLVSDRAVDSDQGQKIVYVVDDKNEVSARPVQLGALHHGMRAIEGGLSVSDRIVVVGLPQVRPGIIVQPKVVEMPAAVTQQ
jgi:RND family efflux transporter MFP subunit